MFEQLFTKPGTIGRYQAAPLVEPRERYLRHLAESGASRLTLRQIALDQVRLLHVLDLSEGEKVTVSRIEAIAPKWDRTRHHKLGHRRATSQKSTKRALSRATRWLRFLGWLDELEEERHPYGVEAGAFEEWMRTERGCSEEAISGKLGSVNEFFDWLATSGKPLASVRITDIDGAIAAKTARRNYSRVTIRVRPETLCRITEFSEHESNGRELDEGERVAVEVLPVLGQSAAAVEPGDGAFDHPTPGLDDEALHPIGSLDDLGLEIGQDAGQGAVKDRPLIGAVGEQFPEKGKQTEQGRQQRETAVAILNVGGGDDAVQQQALRIDQNMPLLALDQLAGIEAVAVDASPPFSALFTL